MDIPQIVFETPSYNLNITIWLSVLTICLTAMATLVKIFGNPLSEKEKPGGTPFCLQNIKDINKNVEAIEKLSNKNEELKTIANGLEKEVEVLKTETTNTNKNLEEIRSSSKEVATRLDDLLKQLLEWMND